ncbi:translation initiation factor IF-2 [Chloroflexota bacterium]
MSKTTKKIEFPTNLSVRDLAQSLEASPIDVIKSLMNNGVMASINQLIDYDTAAIVAEEFGFEANPLVEESEQALKSGELPYWRKVIAEEDEKSLVARPPVVTILGHVDHGKTSLLDVIRKSDVAGGEAGGITQHIGAYQIVHKKRAISFLDTPGHAAFTAMRARGAQGADIVILVVAADDGVKPQTKEAIAHAQAAQVPIIVALNKMDKPNANPDNAKKQLGELNLVPDEWGGSTIMVPVSAKEKTGIDDLLEAILLVADNTDIRANPKGKVIGTVIEAERDKTKGVMATLLVQNGTLKDSDVVIAGTTHGKIKAMFDFRGKPTSKAKPSVPVSVLGLNDVPTAGDLFEVIGSDKEARQIVSDKTDAIASSSGTIQKASLEELFANFQAGETKSLNLIIKVDVQGSLEPIKHELEKLSQGEIEVVILHADTGNISENDIMLAAASEAIVIGFNVQADIQARRRAEKDKISIRLYEIIYRMTEDIEKALKGMLDPVFAEKVIGKAEVLQVFPISKIGKIAGCRVREGEILRNAKIHIFRGEDIVYEGEIASLKHEKDDVREVRQGFECGIHFKNFSDIEVGDTIECYSMEKTN